MKYFVLPAAVLAALISLSLFNSRAMAQNTDIWVQELEKAQLSSAEENWDETVLAVEAAYEHWLSRETYLHIVCVHEDLNNAESLFRRCLILSHDGDIPEFHSNIAELISQLKLLSQAESVSLKNIL